MEYAKTLPSNRDDIYTIEELSHQLSPLLGMDFPLSGQPKTDGSKLRKLVANQLGLSFETRYKNKNKSSTYILDKKGVPKITRQLITTYLATPPYGNNSYNLQVWNYNPSIPDNPLIFDKNGNTVFTYDDIRQIIVWVNRTNEHIESLSILTPKRVQSLYGPFGKPTIKYQMIISEKLRNDIYFLPNKILVGNDHLVNSYNDDEIFQSIKSNKNTALFKETPNLKNLYSLNFMSNKLNDLVGKKLDIRDTKLTGQALEIMVIERLGYTLNHNELENYDMVAETSLTPQYGSQKKQDLGLEGLYPDIKNQLLEIKVQQKQTVDLGRYSPQEEVIIEGLNFTPKQIRYFIALVSDTGIIEGFILMYGEDLLNYYHFVPEKNYKCQRSIPQTLYTENIDKVFS